MECKICGNSISFFSAAKILGKYNIYYYKCSHCGFIQTEKPYWLNEAYEDAINDYDVGLVSRNIYLSNMTKVFLNIFFNPDGRFLDYGGGYGLYVRLMRDYGYNFNLYEPYCENLFAKGFNVVMDECSNDSYEVITAFELLEHLEDPLEVLEKIFANTDNLLFSTNLVPLSFPKPGDWWYYGLEHGQHISFYTLNSLEIIAKRFYANLYTNGVSLHLVTKKSISPLIFKLFCKNRIIKPMSFIFKRKSLVAIDFENMLKRNK